MSIKYNNVNSASFGLNDFKEEMAMMMFGRSFALAQAGKQCVICGKRAEFFSCDRATREFKISSMCEPCQNEVFETMSDEA
jgi:hypothetical protein